MNTSRVYSLRNNTIDFILHNVDLFHSFDSIYLFGSILQSNKIPNDIDILLVYSTYSEQIIYDISIIQEIFNNKIELPVHLTALSLTEVQEMKLLEKLNSNFLKIK